MGAKSLQDIRVGILGGGFQGRNIAFWFALREFKVIVYDVDGGQLWSIEQEISNSKKKRLLKRFISCSGHLQDLRDCDLVIECVPEQLELKKSVLLKLEKIVQDNAILASNSSPQCYCRALSKKRELY
jgi:3-hydroxybutyryl-CoA dehydrogenase